MTHTTETSLLEILEAVRDALEKRARFHAAEAQAEPA